jgi:hypothetical protein
MLLTKVVEKITTKLLCSMTCFYNRAVYEVMLKSIVEMGRQQLTIWRMRIAC